MTLKDQFFITKNRLLEKRNIILIIVLVIIFLIIFTCLTTIQFCIENKNEILNSEVGRTYIIKPEEEQLDTIKKINNIELLDNTKYYDDNFFEIKDFDTDNEKGEVVIKTLLRANDVKIKHGKNIENNYEMICSNTFYPHFYEDKINKSLYLSSNKILNKNINIISQNEDLNNKEITLNIVGTYKNKFMESANTCYVNKKTYDEIASKYFGSIQSYDDEGNLVGFKYGEYTSYFLRVDNKKYISKVLSNLDDMNISYEPYFILDMDFINMLYNIPLFIGIIIIILTFSILYNFITKKNHNRFHNIGILKAIGYDEKTITSLTINENILIIFISCIISLFIYLIILDNLKYTLLAEVTYNNYILNVPIILIILLIVLLIFIIIKICKANFKRISKLSIQELLEK